MEHIDDNLTIKDVAKLLRCSKAHVQNALRGRVPGVRRLDSPPAPSGNLLETRYSAHARAMLTATKDERVLLSALTTVNEAGGDAAFCNGLLGRVKAFDPDVRVTCAERVAKPSKGNVTAAKLIHQDQPVYPMDAKAQRVQGTVSFSARIGKDGKTADLELLSGPLALCGSAQEAVLKWEYQPTTLNGLPVEVSTNVDVSFKLGH